MLLTTAVIEQSGRLQAVTAQLTRSARAKVSIPYARRDQHLAVSETVWEQDQPSPLEES